MKTTFVKITNGIYQDTVSNNTIEKRSTKWHIIDAKDGLSLGNFTTLAAAKEAQALANETTEPVETAVEPVEAPTVETTEPAEEVEPVETTAEPVEEAPKTAEAPKAKKAKKAKAEKPTTAEADKADAIKKLIERLFVLEKKAKTAIAKKREDIAVADHKRLQNLKGRWTNIAAKLEALNAGINYTYDDVLA